MGGWMGGCRVVVVGGWKGGWVGGWVGGWAGGWVGGGGERRGVCHSLLAWCADGGWVGE